jgi:hypothetical protein
MRLQRLEVPAASAAGTWTGQHAHAGCSCANLRWERSIERQARRAHRQRWQNVAPSKAPCGASPGRPVMKLCGVPAGRAVPVSSWAFLQRGQRTRATRQGRRAPGECSTAAAKLNRIRAKNPAPAARPRNSGTPASSSGSTRNTPSAKALPRRTTKSAGSRYRPSALSLAQAWLPQQPGTCTATARQLGRCLRTTVSLTSLQAAHGGQSPQLPLWSLVLPAVRAVCALAVQRSAPAALPAPHCASAAFRGVRMHKAFMGWSTAHALNTGAGLPSRCGTDTQARHAQQVVLTSCTIHIPRYINPKPATAECQQPQLVDNAGRR